jgi:putative transposase
MTNRSPFRYFKTSPEVIRLAVMLYMRFPLSLRNVEDLLHERGVEISHETVRYWWNRFGPLFASEIRRRRTQGLRQVSRWRWHLDEMYVKINGEMHYLWRAVDHEGEVLESFVTRKRDRKAALKFLKKAMRRYGRPVEIVTDRLRSYGAALKDLGRGDDRETGRWVNNRAENSHLPFRRRERAMLRFRQMRSLQKFASVHGSIYNHFNQERALYSRESFKAKRTGKVLNDDRADWREAWALFPGDVAYVWHGALHATTVAESLIACGFAIRSQIIWAKERLVLSRGDYHWQHEPCWYAVRQKATGHWAGDRKQTTLWQIASRDQDAKTVHGTQKPVECMRRPMLNNASPGQAVYEPFSGSGTSIIAAETCGRACHAMELDPTYVDVAVTRWQAFTGKAAVLEGDGRSFAEVALDRAEPRAVGEGP